MRSAISVIIIVLSGALFFGYTKGAYVQIQQTQQMNTQYDSALSKAAQLQQVVQALLSKYNAINPADLSRLQTMLPDQVNNIGLILDLDTLAHQYGLSLEGVTIGDSDGSTSGSSSNTSSTSGKPGLIGSKSTAYGSLEVSFTIHATYGQFTQFISGLQQSLRIVDLVKVSVTGGSDVQSSTPASLAQPAGSAASQAAVYSFGITLRTYWLK